MQIRVCPFSVAVFFGTALWVTHTLRRQKKKLKDHNETSTSETTTLPPCQVIFVLGAPGTGKGTQCQLIVERRSGWVHLSAGDLLRAERKKASSALADTINACISQGKLVPSEVTCKLIENAMAESYQTKGTTTFLIDGFPRSFGNATAWQETMSNHRVEFVLHFEAPEEVLTGRLLERGQTSGRVDDNLETIRKRFQTNLQETAPVVAEYEAKGLLRRIPSDQPVEDVYKQVEALLETISIMV